MNEIIAQDYDVNFLKKEKIENFKNLMDHYHQTNKYKEEVEDIMNQIETNPDDELDEGYSLATIDRVDWKTGKKKLIPILINGLGIEPEYYKANGMPPMSVEVLKELAGDNPRGVYYVHFFFFFFF